MSSNPRLDDLLQQAFAVLDAERILELARAVEPKAAVSDGARLALAYGMLSRGDTEAARAWLAGGQADGTASLADLAFVRAFLAQQENNHAGAVQLLEANLQAEGATHPRRMRLSLADSYLKLNRADLMVEVLQPLMAPPGVPETLEAHLIIMDGMLRGNADRERVIELTALLDVMLERGFRLRSAAHAVYYAQLMELHRIEGLVGPLLKAHEALLDKYETDDEAEIEFLLSAGEKYKAAGAVRVAGRSYAKHPFRWRDQDPEKVVFVLGNHEEHEAARQTTKTCFGSAQIRKNVKLWGPLILSCYYAGRWKEALDLIIEHRIEMKSLKMHDNAIMVRAVCEYLWGRLRDSLKTIRGLGLAFYEEAGGNEAAVEVLALIRLGEPAQEVGAAARRALQMSQGERQFQHEYLNYVLMDLLIRKNLDKIPLWAEALLANLQEGNRTTLLLTMGQVALEWGEAGVARALAEKLPDGSWEAMFLRGVATAQEHDLEEGDRLLAEAEALADGRWRGRIGLQRVRWQRAAGEHERALELLEALTQKDYAPGASALTAMRAGILRDQGAGEDVLAPLRAQVDATIKRDAQSRENFMALFAEGRQFYEGDRPEQLLALAKATRAGQPGTSEILRLARRVQKHPHAPEEMQKEAAELEALWMKEQMG